MTKFIPLPCTAAFKNWTEPMESVNTILEIIRECDGIDPYILCNALTELRDRLNETAHLQWLYDKELFENLEARKG